MSGCVERRLQEEQDKATLVVSLGSKFRWSDYWVLVNFL